jgi:hypothetical protein
MTCRVRLRGACGARLTGCGSGRCGDEHGGAHSGDLYGDSGSGDRSAALSRRAFLVRSAGFGSALMLVPLARVARADSEKLSVTDPAARAVGYTEAAAQVDKSRYPSWSASQNCGNCSLFQGKSGDAWGGCTLFGTKQVAAAGWCSSYTNM